MISTGAMTDVFLRELINGADQAVVLLVGDGVAPTEGGWTAGSPNSGEFVPYSVVGFEGASPAYPEINWSDPEWSTRWTLRHYGGSREQADWQAMMVRDRVLLMLKQRFGETDPFKVISLVWNSLGGLSRNDQVDPPYWQSSDVVMLSVSRVSILP